MYQITINLHSFDELSKPAKQNAVNEHTQFLIEMQDPENEMNDYIPDDTEVIDNIKINEYLFYVNGDLASMTQYTGEHHKSGKLEAKFKGQIFQLN